MTASEDEIIRDQQELAGLQKAMADVETALAVSTPGARRILENSLQGIKDRVATLGKKIEEAKVEHEAEVRAQVAVAAALAEKETELNAKEKEIYNGFLAKEFFTKKDFKGLEQFYSHTWDRLSESGKDEMSHRVWEGIRRDEYRFTDLPQVVQEKEAKLAYNELTAPSVNHSSLQQIPETDRDDFVTAYQNGNRKEACQVLNRDGFRRNMALETSAGTKHQAVDDRKEINDQPVVDQAKSKVERPNDSSVASAASAQFADIALDTLKSKGVSLVSASSSPSVAALPDASGPSVKVR